MTSSALIHLEEQEAPFDEASAGASQCALLWMGAASVELSAHPEQCPALDTCGYESASSKDDAAQQQEPEATMACVKARIAASAREYVRRTIMYAKFLRKQLYTLYVERAVSVNNSSIVLYSR